MMREAFSGKFQLTASMSIRTATLWLATARLSRPFDWDASAWLLRSETSARGEVNPADDVTAVASTPSSALPPTAVPPARDSLSAPAVWTLMIASNSDAERSASTESIEKKVNKVLPEALCSS